MIQKGNTKLGKAIYTFSLPAHWTCPGETPACAEVCYAMDGFYNMQNVVDSLNANYTASQQGNFAEQMIAAIGRRSVETFRIHPSGDFYEAAYVRKWIEIAERYPNIRFYAYTRSWRNAEILEALTDLAALPNVSLWWSTDKDTDALNGAPPIVANVKVAYMQVADDEVVPGYTDLVFRVKRDTVLFAFNGVRVCPAENGVTYETKPTCSQCKLCYTAQLTSREPCTAVLAESISP